MTAATHDTDADCLARVEAWMRENNTSEAPSLRRVKQVAQCGDGRARRVLDELLARYGDPQTVETAPERTAVLHAVQPAPDTETGHQDADRPTLETLPVPVGQIEASYPSRDAETPDGTPVPHEQDAPSRDAETPDGTPRPTVAETGQDAHQDRPVETGRDGGTPQVSGETPPVSTTGTGHQDGPVETVETPQWDTLDETQQAGVTGRQDAPSRDAETPVETAPSYPSRDAQDAPVETPVPPAARPRGRRLWWLFAAVGLGISAHTSWEFFTAWWTGSPWYLRAVLCFAIELGIIAASREMHVEAQAGRHARKAQLIAWSGCAVAFGMAVWLYAGAGLVFGAIGPVAAVIGLHSALGLELRNATGHQRGAVAAELVERVKARFGLADDDRDAARRIRDRHAVRAGRLAARGELGNWRTRQLRRAITKAEISRDARSREIMLAEQATLRGLEGLTRRDTAAPWDTVRT